MWVVVITKKAIRHGCRTLRLVRCWAAVESIQYDVVECSVIRAKEADPSFKSMRASPVTSIHNHASAAHASGAIINRTMPAKKQFATVSKTQFSDRKGLLRGVMITYRTI